ncbi:unnamed protein product [Boreogadus saida]
MRKAEVQTTQKRGAADEAGPRSGGVDPPVPPKRPNTTQSAPQPRQPSPTPPAFLRKMRNAAVGTGCDIRLKVSVGGDPQPSLYWYHNDDLLNMDNQEYGGLWIRDCKPSDAGLYTCIASNHLGDARSSAVLAVLDLGEGSRYGVKGTGSRMAYRMASLGMLGDRTWNQSHRVSANAGPRTKATE